MVINKEKSTILTKRPFDQKAPQTTSYFIKQVGFNLLTEQSLINTYSFTDKLIMAQQRELFNCGMSINNSRVVNLLNESPFNDEYLLKNWLAHYQLTPQKLDLLLDTKWLEEANTIKIPWSASCSTAKDEILVDEALSFHLLLNKVQLGKLAIFKPQISNACKRIDKALSTCSQQSDNAAFEIETLIFAFLPQLLNRINSISQKAIAFVEHKYDAQQDESALRYRLYNHFPAMLKQINQATLNWSNYLIEFALNLVADFSLLQSTFFNEQPLGQLKSIASEHGDFHDQGRFVLICQFKCGKKLAYKPRSLSIEQKFYQFLKYIAHNSDFPELYQPTYLLRDSYGWMEHIAPKACRDQQQIQKYFYHSGCLLSVLHLLEAEDIHFENVIAHQESPVVIDLETLFHLREDNVISKKVQDVNHSVLKSHFIPQYELSDLEQDPAAMCLVRDSAQEINRQSLPTLSGKTIPLNEHCEDFINGFAFGYQQLMQLKKLLPQQLNQFKGIKSRHLARPTHIYHSLWHSSCQPYYQQSVMKQELCYEKLWLDSKKRPDLAKIIDAEKNALLQGDIPLFTNIIGERSISLANKIVNDAYFKLDSLSLVSRKLSNFSQQACQAQIKIIKHSLKLQQHNKPSLVQNRLLVNNISLNGCSNQHWLDVSNFIGQQVLRSSADSESSLFWLVNKYAQDGLACIDGTNYSLHDGSLGILFYLAYLNSVKPDHTNSVLIKRSTMEILDTLLNESFVEDGCGAYEGLSGIVYFISHVLNLWGDESLYSIAKVFIAKLASLVNTDSVFDVMAGSSGAILSLLSYYKVSPDPQTIKVATSFGDHLISAFIEKPEGCGWPNKNIDNKLLTGFSHGSAGIAYSLMRLYEVTGINRYLDVAIKAVTFEQANFCSGSNNWPDLRFDCPQEQKKKAMTAWCNGAVGIGLSRLSMLGIGDQKMDELLKVDIAHAKQNVQAKTSVKSFGLCHGFFGNQEFIQQLILNTQFDEITQKEFNSSINQSLSKLNTHGLSDDKNRFETLGLMNGLSGIGYQLLRFTLPERFPSILMLQPPVK